MRSHSAADLPTGTAPSAGKPPGPGLRRAVPPFLLGLNAQVAQLLVLREALILSSGSETALGVCLGAWALFNGLGALAANALARSGFAVGRLFTILLALMPLLLAGSLHLARVARSFTDVPTAEHLPITTFLILVCLAVGPVTLLDGFLFVSGLDFLFGKSRSGKGAAFMYGVESSGSLAGGVVFSFVLVFLLDPFATAGLLLLVNALLLPPGAGGEGALRAGSRASRAVRGLMVCAGAAALVFGPHLNGLSEGARWKVLQPRMELLETRESAYQNLALLRYRDETTVFGNGGVLFALRPRPSEESGEWDRAVFSNFAMLQHESPQNVLLIGGGCKGVLADILLHGPEHVDWVESDPALVDLVENRLVEEERAALRDPKVHHHLTDGRFFINSAKQDFYDLVICDLPDPSNASANRFYTLEFFEECELILRPGGVIVFNLSCQPNFIGREMMERNGSIVRALAEVFDNILLTPGEASFLAASDAAPLTASADALRERYDSRGIATPRFSPLLFYTWFEDDDVAWINRMFRERLDEGTLPVNRDDRPVAYFKDYLLWRRITESGGEETRLGFLERWLSGAGEREPPVLWVPLGFPAAGLILLLAFLAGRRGGRLQEKAARALLFVTAAAVGFNGIVLEMVLLLAYQGVAGHLYSRMGMIIAAYMAGLTLGSLLPSERRFYGGPFLFSCLCTFAGAAAALICMHVIGMTGPGSRMPLFGVSSNETGALIAFAAVTLVLGVSGGQAFRGAAVGLERGGASPGGVIYALDILGTCLGGLLAGSVLVPFLGLTGTLLLAGGINVMLPLFCLCALSLVRRDGSVRV